MSGVLGSEATAWDAETVYSERVERMASVLGDAVPAQSTPAGAWLTTFEDHHWPSGTEDLFFVPSTDGSPVIPEPIEVEKRIRIPLMLDVVAIALGCWYLFRRSARRRNATGRAT